MNPGTSGTVKDEKEPLDHDHDLEENYLDHETTKLFESEDVKVDSHYTEPGPSPTRAIIKKEAQVQKESKQIMILNSTSGQQRTSVLMNPDTLGCVKVEEPSDHDHDLEESSLDRKSTGIFEIEDIKVEPHYTELGSPPTRVIIKEEAEVQKESKQPMRLNSTSGEQRASVELEIKVESDDLGIWEVEPMDVKSKEIIYGRPRKSINQWEMVNRSGEVPAVAKKRPLKTRMSIRSGEKPHECGICTRAFAQNSQLKSHMMVHSGEKPYGCNICKKAFAQKSTLRTHMLIHSGEKPYECGICMRAFSQRQHLKTHMMIHCGEKPYECGICKRAFSQKRPLKRHMLIHSAEKPHKCNICMKAFLRESSLRTHMMIHSGEKPYECNICMKAYSRKSSLNLHVVIHNGENPYKCRSCEKAFPRKAQLKTHMLIHRVKRYMCNICMSEFTQKSSLRTHIETC